MNKKSVFYIKHGVTKKYSIVLDRSCVVCKIWNNIKVKFIISIPIDHFVFEIIITSAWFILVTLARCQYLVL